MNSIHAFFVPLIIGFLFITGCGYRFGQGELTQRYSTISVPYVKGDRDGALTAEIIKQLTNSGGLSYQADGADLILQVEIMDFRDENIGFRYDRNKEGKLKRSIIPTETRTTVQVELSLIESESCTTILGPVRLAAFVDYDHDYYSSRDEINIFSLGQLSDYDAARDAMFRPLNLTLAQKIVDYVYDNW